MYCPEEEVLARRRTCMPGMKKKTVLEDPYGNREAPVRRR